MYLLIVIIKYLLSLFLLYCESKYKFTVIITFIAATSEQSINERNEKWIELVDESEVQAARKQLNLNLIINSLRLTPARNWIWIVSEAEREAMSELILINGNGL